MATIINSLEVIVEQPQPQPSETTTPSPPPRSVSAIRPRDLEDIAERQRRQAARRAAH